MKTTVAQVLIFSMIMLGYTGCTTMADSIQARGKNPRIVYQVSHAELWKAFPDIVVAAGLKFVSANREDNTVLAQKGITPFSWGENVAIFVEKVGEDKASVEIASKKAMETNVLAPNWTKPILEQLDRRYKRA